MFLLQRIHMKHQELLYLKKLKKKKKKSRLLQILLGALRVKITNSSYGFSVAQWIKLGKPVYLYTRSKRLN